MRLAREACVTLAGATAQSTCKGIRGEISAAEKTLHWQPSCVATGSVRYWFCNNELIPCSRPRCFRRYALSRDRMLQLLEHVLLLELVLQLSELLQQFVVQHELACAICSRPLLTP